MIRYMASNLEKGLLHAKGIYIFPLLHVGYEVRGYHLSTILGVVCNKMSISKTPNAVDVPKSDILHFLVENVDCIDHNMMRHEMQSSTQ